MEGHAVKYRGRQVFFVRVNLPLLGSGTREAPSFATEQELMKVRRTPRESAAECVRGNFARAMQRG